jgi:hypothetical protein
MIEQWRTLPFMPAETLSALRNPGFFVDPALKRINLR